jgi:hypothetical protein
MFTWLIVTSLLGVFGFFCLFCLCGHLANMNKLMQKQLLSLEQASISIRAVQSKTNEMLEFIQQERLLNG